MKTIIKSAIQTDGSGGVILSDFDYIFDGLVGSTIINNNVGVINISAGSAIISGKQIDYEETDFNMINNNFNIVVINKQTGIMGIRYSRDSSDIRPEELLVYIAYVDSNIVTAEISGPRKPVTIDNVDLTTFTSLNGMPIARRTVGIGYGLIAVMTRIGNTVILNMNNTTNSSLPQADQQRLGETIPTGYRPSTKNGNAYVVGIVVVGPGQRIGWTIETGGGMSISCTGTTSGAIRVMNTGSWITEDDFPTLDIQ